MLTKGSGAYLEAFSAFQANYGEEIKYYDLSAEKLEIAPDTRTIIAFGGKAAALNYPPGLNIIYCMSPGFTIKAAGRQGKVVKISMLPAFSLVLDRIKLIQPPIKRLAVFWMTPDFAVLEEQLSNGAGKQGIAVSTVQIRGSGDLPGLLRSIKGSAEAFWIPPDPLLVTSENLMLLREFSWNNGIPFYASSKGLAREGATAAISVDFIEVGAAAAKAAAALRAGEAQAPVIYPDRAELTLNLSAAKKCGLSFSRDAIKRADLMFP